MMTQAQWSKLLDANPQDMELRLAYSTWLQDDLDDHARAEFQQWMIKNDVNESMYPDNKPFNDAEKGWTWYYCGGPPTEPKKHATLGEWAVLYMPQTRWLWNTRTEAEEALFKAWQEWQAKRKRLAKRKRPRIEETK